MRVREPSRVRMMALVVAVGLTLASLGIYSVMMALFAREVRRRRRGSTPEDRGAERAPRVAILKPLAGSDDDLEENLESFARLSYPSFEMLLGIASRGDPAFEVARRFVDRHPEIDAQIVLTDPKAALNPKVAQLVGLDRVATGEVYVISDSNVRVRPTYLWSMVDELADPRVGIVTSLFSGTGERSVGAALENLQICASTAPGIASMNAATGRPFTVGKSMALRPRDLAALGGFASFGSVLAEDHLLGRKFLMAGFEARVASDVVENRNVRCSVRRTFERHTRWAKLRRSLFPLAFYAEPALNPMAVAGVALLVVPSRAMVALCLAVVLTQIACAAYAVRLLRGRVTWWCAPLELVRSGIALLCWICACCSRTLTWRGHPFRLLRGTAIVPIAPPPARAAKSAGERLPA